MKVLCILLCVAFASSFYIDNNGIHENKIFGGDHVKIEDVPYQASLLSWMSIDNICGATIIHEFWVITAAHCVENQTRVSVQTGSKYRHKMFGKEYRSEHIIRHADYNEHSDNNDIALIKLVQPIKFNKKQQPIAIAKPHDIPKEGELMRISGFGRIGDDLRATKAGDKKRWIHDPNNELCRPLNCKKSEICLLEDAFTAVCVSKKDLHKSRAVVVSKSRAAQQRKMRTDASIDAEDDDAFFDSEDDDEDQDESKCQECAVLKPIFLCGNDNRTYSSPCRLEYHNCIHHTSVRINCTGFCPCKHSDSRMHSKKLQRQKSLLGKSKSNHDITLTPRDFNYDNHHYQYLKYSKRAKNQNSLKYEDKQSLMSNEVMEKTSAQLKSSYSASQSRGSADCPASSKPAMANRLLDWFSVVMADSKHRRQHPKPRGHFPIGCQSEVRWMFGHLDTDSDGRISLSELYGLEHDQNEPCLKPFLDACDVDGDIFVSGPEWCGCFSKAERPCAAVRRRSSPEVAPNCDSRGYYQSTQCHRGLGLCWCVDQHGIEFAGTRVRGSKPDCDSIVNKISNGGIKTNSVDLMDDEDSASDFEGSADLPLDF